MTSRIRSRRARIAVIAGTTAAGCLVAACGSSSSGGGSSPGSTASASGATATGAALSALNADLQTYSSSANSYPAVKPISGVAALKGKTVWYIPDGAVVPILATYGDSIKQAMAAVGITVKTCDGKFLPTTIASCLEQAGNQGADGVITGYIDYKEDSSSFDALVAKHIPVLVAGTVNDVGRANSSMLSVYDTTAGFNLAQKLSIESVITDSAGKAKILYIGATDSPQTIEGNAYVKSFVAQHCPGCTFAEVDYNTAEIGKIPSQVSAGLTSHASTTYVVDEFDSTSAFTLEGIQNAGFTGKVKLAAVDGSLDSLQRLRTGGTPQFVDVGVSPSYTGWSFADGMLRMLTGSTPITQVGVLRVFTKANVAGLPLTPAAYGTNAWYGSDAYMTTFTTAWGTS